MLITDFNTLNAFLYTLLTISRDRGLFFTRSFGLPTFGTPFLVFYPLKASCSGVTHPIAVEAPEWSSRCRPWRACRPQAGAAWIILVDALQFSIQFQAFVYLGHDV